MNASADKHAWIGLGANLGNAVQVLQAAIDALAQHPHCRLLAQSSFYSTAPVGCEPGQPDYTNAAIELQTSLAPDALLALLLEVEQQFGRTRAYRNAPRTLDLDLLLIDQLTLNQPLLQLPHPRMHERAFVLAPLAQIAPHLSIPGRGKVADLLLSIDNQPIQILP